MSHRTLVVLSLDLPMPESITDVLADIDPPNLPYSNGVVRVVTEPYASRVEMWLDAE